MIAKIDRDGCISCCVLGLLLVWALERKGLGERLFEKS